MSGPYKRRKPLGTHMLSALVCMWQGAPPASGLYSVPAECLANVQGRKVLSLYADFGDVARCFPLEPFQTVTELLLR